MKKYTQITSEEANLIGEFYYYNGKIFSPFVGKQANGNFIVSREMYDLLKDSTQFKTVDWSGKNWVSIEELDFEKIKI